MAILSKETVYSVLRSVQWEGVDIVSKEMLEGVTFSAEKEGTKVNLILRAENKKDFDADTLKSLVEKAVKGIDGVSSVSVIFTAHKETHKREQPSKKMDLPGIKTIIAVASGKGGVGKSTTAVNLAVAFAQKGLKTGLMDADVYGPSIPRMIGVDGEPDIDASGRMVPHTRDGVKVMSMGFLIDDASPMIWRGPMVAGAVLQMFRDVSWGELDVLVVDLPPGTGDTQLSLIQSTPLSGAVIVSTPQDIALLDARRALEMFRKTGVPVLGIVENMSFFECPHCKGRSDIFGHGGARAQAEKLNVPFLGEIPLDIEIRELSDGGEPLALTKPESFLAVRYREIADSIWGILNP